MKRSFSILIALIAIVQFSYSQNCTQCDNTASPTGTFASEIGENTTAEGGWSFSGGYASESMGVVSFSHGANCYSAGAYSVTLGHSIKSNGMQSMVIGTGAGNGESELLTNNVSQSLMIGFGSEKPTLFVGPSWPGYTGSIGIGDVTNPQAKLHIKADDGEAATVYIEPHSFTAGESAKLRLGTMDYGISSGYGRLYFNTGGNYIFNSTDAYVGIGTLTPHEKLEVNGNIKQAIGAWLQTDEIKPAGESGLKLNDETGAGIIVKNGGKVGIGVPNPSHILDVDGTIATTAFQLNYGSGTDDGYDGWVLQADALGNATWTNPMLLEVDDNDWAFGTGDDIYKLNGNVGIGNNSPTVALDVTGTVKATSFEGDGSGLSNTDDNDWAFGAGDDIYKLNGKVGIGTSTPVSQFEISKNISGGGQLGMRIINSGSFPWFIGMDNDHFGQNTLLIADYNNLENNETALAITSDGRVGVGKEPGTGIMLDVDGKIMCGELEIINLTEWKDCVFEKGYNLPSLSQVKSFIDENGHLPGIPSEKEVLDKGYDVGEMDAMLLQKIEELTLYVIELEREIETLKSN